MYNTYIQGRKRNKVYFRNHFLICVCLAVFYKKEIYCNVAWNDRSIISLLFGAFIVQTIYFLAWSTQCHKLTELMFEE